MRRVVLTGAGVVSPIGSSLPRFFAGLRSATPGVDFVASFDASSFPTRIAGEVRDLDLDSVAIDGPDQALGRRDRKVLFGLAAAREALTHTFGGTCVRPHYPAERVGLFCATGLEIFHLADVVARLREQGIDVADLLPGPGASRAALQSPADLAARVLAREAGIRGLRQVNVSACAAGTQAIGEALRAIRDGAVDAALCGGYDSMVNPLGLGGFCLLGALSRSNELRGAASRPFDARRDGFVLGEGAGFFVLEELGAARARGAPLLGELCGYASSLDAFRVSDPNPDQQGAVRCLRGAIADAGLRPEQIDYVNAHGTGTRKNDPVETAALHQVFGAHARRLLVSSTKSQVGHLIGAAGAVELAASLLALGEGLVPATINLESPDPACDLDYVAREPRRASVRYALSSSFGFGGQNASIVIGGPDLGP